MEMFLNLEAAFSRKLRIGGPSLLKGISWVKPALALLVFSISV
jgi:hypothetical protein